MRRISKTLIFLFGLFALSPANSANDCGNSRDVWLDLSVAIRLGNVEKFHCLISQVHGQHFDPSDNWEQTPLHIASRYDQYKIAEYLLQNGATVKAQNAIGETPLLTAIKHDSEDTAALLVFKGSNLEYADPMGRTALFWAVSKNNITLVRLLTEQGANMRRRFQGPDGSSISLKEYALKMGNDKIINIFKSSQE